LFKPETIESIASKYLQFWWRKSPVNNQYYKGFEILSLEEETYV